MTILVLLALVAALFAMLCNKFYHDWKAQKESWKVYDSQIILDPNEESEFLDYRVLVGAQFNL